VVTEEEDLVHVLEVEEVEAMGFCLCSCGSE